ncbi:MAG: EAL domain-containing protein [Burkholderiales bacterium]|nr:EAL domain-containing protein [Burkholderiales bacterium]
MPNPIHLGILPPLSGVVNMYGTELVNAARIACAEINENGGVLGRWLELVIEDDGSLPATAVAAAQRLIDQHQCVAIIGNLLSNSRIAVANQVAEPRRIPYLNFSFYEGGLSGRYFFHFAALPNQQIDKMIPFMAHRFGLKMFFAGNNYEWPRGSIDAAKRVLQRLDGEIVGEQYIPLGVTVAEVDRLLEQVMHSGADVFVPYFAGTDQLIVLNRFSELGLKNRMAVAMGHFDEMMASHLSPEVRAGLYSSNTYFMSVDSDENQRYLQRLKNMPGINGIWPNGNGVLTNFGEATYLCVHAFAKAAQQAGSLDADALVASLETVVVKGPQGVLEMDAASHHASVNTFLARCDANGVFDIVESFGSIQPQIPARYLVPQAAAVAPIYLAVASPENAARLAQEILHADSQGGIAQQILTVADMAIIVTDAKGIILECNPSSCLMFGYRAEELLGISVHLLLPPHFRQQHAVFLQRFVDGEQTSLSMNGRREIMGYRKDGSFFAIEASVAKIMQNGQWLMVVTMRDISERKNIEEAQVRQASYDSLTGLPKRSLIHKRLINALQRAARSDMHVALLLIDLDGFKLINNSQGHDVGDKVLKAVARRLMEQVRPGDTVARVEGDAFVILCEQVADPSSMGNLAERIIDSLRVGFDFHEMPIFLTASIGIATSKGTTHQAEDLLRFADTAMLSVKEKTRNGWQFFNESLQQQVTQRLILINGLRVAIERNEFSTRYQPIVVAESGRIVGAELLLRWHAPQGDISPAVFIPIAEATGSILAIGTWVFRQACRAQVEWQQRWGEQAPYISVNVSPRQLSDTALVEQFTAILAETGASATQILLEITETSLMADVETNLRVLHQLAALGLRVAVDDFGTGYSSLAQLTRLPVAVLKIDRAFVDGLAKTPEDRTVVRAIIGLGHALGLKLVAEGVETASQQMELCAYGCNLIQGYYFHRPLEHAAFIDTFNLRAPESTQGTIASELYFLIYISQAKQALTEEELLALQGKASAHNRQFGVTGCLLYQDEYFLQMLEGNKDTIQSLMDKIRADPRHHQVQIVIESATNKRIFTDWSMGLRNLSKQLDEPDFQRWQMKKHSFLTLAEDARLCYRFITAYRWDGIAD